ncbi:hypothetical protein RN001_000606 [Aquatica leii]|uniref:Mitochondrial cytochrome c oxidase subunit VIc/VIIs domain-containing protein n=1 Tax=Aquatica leii TaxID=1421715 RepID=A0AAN7PA87_9COLE|nr:hypothetical protein RN001_000606 [Aquatica leii]
MKFPVKMSALAKPQLRRLLQDQIKKNLIVALTLSATCGFLFKTFVGDVRKKQYLNFYKDYDVEKEFHEMRNKGLFDSCAPDS